MQVGVAEAVDRPFGVADEKERQRRVAVERVEDRELQRVGVLELVDQRRRVARPHPRRGQRRRCRRRGARKVEQACRRTRRRAGGALPQQRRCRRAAAAAAMRDAAARARTMLGTQVEQVLRRAEERMPRRRAEFFFGTCFAVPNRSIFSGASTHGSALASTASQPSAAVSIAASPRRRWRAAGCALPQALDDLVAPGLPEGARAASCAACSAAMSTSATGCRARSASASSPGLGEVLREPGKAVRRVAPFGEVGGERRRRTGCDLAAPEVVHGLGDELGIVGERFEGERQLRRERRVGERALAKAVDREDRRLVEALQRGVEPRAMVRRRANARAASRRAGHEGSPPALAPPRRWASVSTRRARMRSRSSATGRRLVNVTTRICCTGSARSSSRRRYRPHRFQVLPVPAEASIRRVPPISHVKTSSGVVSPASPSVLARFGARHSATRPRSGGVAVSCALPARQHRLEHGPRQVLELRRVGPGERVGPAAQCWRQAASWRSPKPVNGDPFHFALAAPSFHPWLANAQADFG